MASRVGTVGDWWGGRDGGVQSRPRAEGLLLPVRPAPHPLLQAPWLPSARGRGDGSGATSSHPQSITQTVQPHPSCSPHH